MGGIHSWLSASFPTKILHRKIWIYIDWEILTSLAASELMSTKAARFTTLKRTGNVPLPPWVWLIKSLLDWPEVKNLPSANSLWVMLLFSVSLVWILLEPQQQDGPSAKSVIQHLWVLWSWKHFSYFTSVLKSYTEVIHNSLLKNNQPLPWRFQYASNSSCHPTCLKAAVFIFLFQMAKLDNITSSWLYLTVFPDFAPKL